MIARRTDLAVEAHELWKTSAEETTKLSGIKAKTVRREGYPVTTVQVLDAQGAEALGKPEGEYLTIDYTAFWRREPDFFQRAVRVLGDELRSLLPSGGSALVVGLGNAAMTPDAVGPETLRHLLITRHLVSAMPRQFAGFRSVSAFAANVLGNTGVESAEAVRGLAEETKPDFIIVVDALAARRTSRLCNTVQLSNTGIGPGSGVGNHREALNEETLGVPVFSVGVPTVVDAATLTADLLEENGVAEIREELLKSSRSMTVTPRDIDQQVRDLSKVVGYGINWALQELEIEEITALLS